MSTRFLSFGLALLLPALALAAAEPASSKEPAVADRALDDKELEAMWKDLARDDDEGTRTAYRQIRVMSQSPTASVAFLKKQLKPIAAPDAKAMAQWIEDLDSGDFNTREKATRELGRIGVLAAAGLKKKLDGPLPSLELRRRVERLLDKLESQSFSSEELRTRRAVEVLFLIATPEARALLEELAKGAPGAPLTDDARASLGALAPLTRK